MRLNDYLKQRPPILFLIDFSKFVCYVSVHSQFVSDAAHCTLHTLLSVRYVIAPVSTLLAHLLRCACALCFFSFYHCVSSTCIRSKYHDHLAFCSSEEMASRKGKTSVNTVSSGSGENCVNNATCTSGCGGSSLKLGVSCISPPCDL